MRNLAIPSGSRTKARSFMRLVQPGQTSTSTPKVRRKSSAHGRFPLVWTGGGAWSLDRLIARRLRSAAAPLPAARAA